MGSLHQVRGHNGRVPSTSQLLAFALASVVLIEIPGPSLMFALGRALTVGRREAVWSVVGNGLGVGVQIGAIAVGLGALVAASAVAFTVLKIAGAVYVVWLGVQAIRHRANARHALAAAGPPRGRPHSPLGTGVMVGLTNPKTLVFFLAFLPQFVGTGHPAAPQVLLLGVIFVALAIASDVCWVMAASRAKAWFARRPQRLDAMNVAGGVVMMGLGAALATTEA
jgi:threonine/homoserine/homoserine lactone efflux protein